MIYNATTEVQEIKQWVDNGGMKSRLLTKDGRVVSLFAQDSGCYCKSKAPKTISRVIWVPTVMALVCG